MAENGNNTDQPQTLQVKPITEQIVVSGRDVEIDLSVYFTVPTGETLSYTVENIPESLVLDPATGMLLGSAPRVEIKMPFFVGVTATTEKSQQSATLYFPLTIIPEPQELTPESNAELAGEGGVTETGLTEETGVFTEAMEDVSFWDAAREWELMKFVQHLINKYYAYVVLYDRLNPPATMSPINFLATHKAKSGWVIIDCGDAIIAVPGDTAYAQYGHRGRLQATMEELFQSELLHKKQWKTIDYSGSDLETLNRVWVAAKKLNVNVVDEAPSEAAEINYINILRLLEKTGGASPRLT